jgi:hypothetical protein
MQFPAGKMFMNIFFNAAMSAFRLSLCTSSQKLGAPIAIVMASREVAYGNDTAFRDEADLVPAAFQNERRR